MTDATPAANATDLDSELDSDLDSDLGQLVDLMAQALKIPLHPDHRPGVIANFGRSAEIAQLVLEFPLPETVEMAPVFEP